MNYSPSHPHQRRRRKSAPILFAALAVLLALVAYSSVNAQIEPQQAEQLAAISPHLEKQLAAANGPVSFLVILDEQVDAQAVVSATDIAGQDRIERADRLYRTLTDHALRSQAPLRKWLDENAVVYRSFYIVNMIEVQGDAELAQSLRTLPGVARLVANPQVAGQQAIEVQPAATWLKTLPVEAPQSASAWADGLYGLAFTHAPEVWALGFTGQGIVVASQDTGVKWDHPALRDSYRGWDLQTSQVTHAYNWFDAWGAPLRTPGKYDTCGPDYQVPCDDYGHGTHTVGTMLGDATNDPSNDYYNPRSILGMAPGAQWIGCRNMLDGIGDPASYADCFQFMLAPYPQDGDAFTDGRPELAPNIINNSWSCPPSEGCDTESLRLVVEKTRAAGQLNVASASNDGQYGCNTIRYPIGMYDAVFTVGAHDRYGDIAYFSSRGPVTSDGSNRLKPDISGPGVSVLSASAVNGNNTYGYASGTSMSSPHVAGAAALLWSAAPDLIGNIDLTEQALIKSATPVDDNQCMNGAPTSPNPVYGYGRLDVLAAVTLARTPWEMVVKVTNTSGDPQADARVVLVDELTNYRHVKKTDGKGFARLKPVFDGSYTLRVGVGENRVVKTGIELEPADNTDTNDRVRRMRITYDPIPTSLDDDDLPTEMLFLPQIGR